ncbi:MAG: cation:proton antiporter [Candidatus Promineifilaceae bacterium]|nr:cation:proton antiporter [Candidatus Promineifilaceae bacterium]
MPNPILQEPAAIFLAVIAVIFIAPILSERVRLPGIVGLILGGIFIGPHGINLLSLTETIELFGAVGLIYLMFNAGLEIDLEQFRAFRNRSLLFFLASYLLPQASGIIIGRAFGLSWPAAVLLGAAYASHTLVAYPVLSRLGILRNEAVSVTVGATIFTDVASLLVLAVVEGSQGGALSLFFLGRLIILAVAYALLILFGVPRLGRIFFRYFSGDVVEFQFVLVVLFIAAVLAEWIGMHTIVGAFLAGLALNNTLARDSRVVQQVLFTGESLFVPLFLMTVGMRLDVVGVFTSGRTVLLGLALAVAVYVTKLAAAWLTGQLFDYGRAQVLTAWGLSQAQAAATLATILVGTEAGLFPELIFNGAILMILATSVTSPFLVQRFGAGLKPPEEGVARPRLRRILVPVTRDEAPEALLNLAARLTRQDDGLLLPLNLASDEQNLSARREQLRAGPGQDPETEVELLDRISEDDAEADEILKEAVESEASLIMLAWPAETGEDERLPGKVADDVVWGATVPVAIADLQTPLNALERVLLVIGAHTVGVKLDDDFVDAAMEVGEALALPLVVMATDHYLERLEARFGPREGEGEEKGDGEGGVQLIRLGSDVVAAVAEEAGEHDLIVMPIMGSQKRLTAEEGRVPYGVRNETKSSLLLLHFP